MSWNIGEKRNLFLKLKSKLGLYLVVPKTPPEKLTLTVVEKQQRPDIENIDSKEVSRLRRQYKIVQENYVSTSRLIDKLIIVAYRYQNNLYLRDKENDLNSEKYQSLLAKEFVY